MRYLKSLPVVFLLLAVGFFLGRLSLAEREARGQAAESPAAARQASLTLTSSADGRTVYMWVQTADTLDVYYKGAVSAPSQHKPSAAPIWRPK